jgi:hypothetical protein
LKRLKKWVILAHSNKKRAVPYRRLPRTDAARLRALETAIKQAGVLNIDQLAFSSRYIHPLRNTHQQLESAKFQQEQTWSQLVRQNKSYQKKIQKTRIYLTHFLQVINMCIAREEFSPADRRYYDLDSGETCVPKMGSEEELLSWGKIIIDGENKRIQAGGTPLMTPTIGKVKAWYEQFKEAYHSQKIVQKSNNRANEKIKLFRENTDILILEVWNEIEAYFSNLPDEKKRDECGKYGLCYIYRKSEKNISPPEVH